VGVSITDDLLPWQQWLLTYGFALSAAALAAIFASFACVVAERWRNGTSITGRSACICGKPIAPWFNVPILGWLVQRGRAHCCKAPIPVRYVMAETIAALVAFAATLWLAPPLAALLSVAGVVLPASACARTPHAAPESP
jgi:prepilin signal peptidase PulO-like enzyme (type II secretory pathway)